MRWPRNSLNKVGNFFDPSTAVYIGICPKKGKGFYVSIERKNKVATYNIPTNSTPTDEEIVDWVRSYDCKIRSKIISIGLSNLENPQEVSSQMWRELDIVPFVFRKTENTPQKQAEKNCWRITRKFNKENLLSIKVGRNREVEVPHFLKLEDYRETASEEEFNYLLEVAREFKKKDLKMVFFSSTKSGGGVALMRHALIRLYKLLGVKVSWHVMNSKKEIFNISKKKFHNILQGVAPAYVKLTDKEIKEFKDWSKKNANRFKKIFQEADVVVIDDPQPSGMIPHIKQINPEVKIIYRSHIQLEARLINEKRPQQLTTWKLLWRNISQAELFVSHPLKQFVPKRVPSDKAVYMPATTDKLDGLNKKLSQKQMNYYFNLFNTLIQRNDQKPLDLSRPYIIQVARFDPSKGIPHLIEAYRILYERMMKEGYPKKKIPQLVIVGNGAVDDPEGTSLYVDTMQILSIETYSRLASDVKVAKLPHCDQLLNTLLKGSSIACQLSLKEGFEIKVSEALLKGKPVIAYRAGGIPLQMEHGVTGYLVKTGNTRKVAEHAYNLLTDKQLYKRMSKAAQYKTDKENTDYFTVNNAYKWLFLALQLAKGEKIKGNHRGVNKIIKEKKK